MTHNDWLVQVCNDVGATVLLAALISAKGTFQLVVPVPFRHLCRDQAFRRTLVQGIASCLEQLATTPMDDLTIYRSHEQNGNGQ